MVRRTLWMAAGILVPFFNHPPTSLQSAAAIRNIMTNLHPTVCNPSVEHCVPRSVCPQSSRDMHGLLCLPAALNGHRSNFKLVEPSEDDDLREWTRVGKGGHAWRHVRRRLFVPPPLYRGAYARSIGYVALTYPTSTNLVHAHVLDFFTLVKWAREYPCTYSEHEKHAVVASYQNNENPFVVDPLRARRDLLRVVDMLEGQLEEQEDQGGPN